MPLGQGRKQVRRTSPQGATGASASVPRSARVACRNCHARKVKCSGGLPCANCRQAGANAKCTYPTRTRRVRVDQSYIDELLKEIQHLRQGSTTSAAPGRNGRPPAAGEVPLAESAAGTEAHAEEAITAGADEPVSAPEDTVRNPLQEDCPWFFPLTPELPILIGEATDAAFATRLRQELSGKSQSHFPRTQHVRDETISSLWQSEPYPWPTPSRARFLLKVAFSTVCRRYYLVRKSSTLRVLEQAIRNPSMCDTLSACKLQAMFSLGEVYSTRTCSSGSPLPGIEYYTSATRILRVLSEQPRIECVEVLLMLSIYSLAMNRRHAAYCMASCAVRFGIIMGLHLSVPHQQLPDHGLREHRKRVWWTAYILDRSWACMLGQPVSIQDSDIAVDLPEAVPSTVEGGAEDFTDPDYLTASLRVANLSAQIAASIYGRGVNRRRPFSCRVQQALRDLGTWLQDLPGYLRKAMDQLLPNADMPIVALHLYFNQCLILASRPVLLHVFRLRRGRPGTPARDGHSAIGDTAVALSEACIQCARRSYGLLTESWIHGTFPTFDYTYTQYLFSASSILAISSLSGNLDSLGDSDDFEAAAQILNELEKNGSFAAKEFCRHIEATRDIIKGMPTKQNGVVCDEYGEHVPHVNRAASYDAQETGPRVDIGVAETSLNSAEPLLQDLLSHSEFDCEFPEAAFQGDGFQAFVWASGGLDDWTSC